jgi:hypothetical protein
MRSAKRELRPAELGSCTSPMAIGAADVTLLDLLEDGAPRLSSGQLRDLACLRRGIPVIEFE